MLKVMHDDLRSKALKAIIEQKCKDYGYKNVIIQFREENKWVEEINGENYLLTYDVVVVHASPPIRTYSTHLEPRIPLQDKLPKFLNYPIERFFDEKKVQSIYLIRGRPIN
jgi:hypothetical protein